MTNQHFRGCNSLCCQPELPFTNFIDPIKLRPNLSEPYLLSIFSEGGTYDCVWLK